jgi:hypothetical protein
MGVTLKHKIAWKPLEIEAILDLGIWPREKTEVAPRRSSLLISA